jgi:hypothetical protein
MMDNIRIDKGDDDGYAAAQEHFFKEKAHLSLNYINEEGGRIVFP